MGGPHFARNQAKRRPGRKIRQIALCSIFLSHAAAGIGRTLKIKYSEV